MLIGNRVYNYLARSVLTTLKKLRSHFCSYSHLEISFYLYVLQQWLQEETSLSQIEVRLKPLFFVYFVFDQ